MGDRLSLAVVGPIAKDEPLEELLSFNDAESGNIKERPRYKSGLFLFESLTR